MLNYNVFNMEINSILIEGLEMRSEIHIFLADAMLFPDMAPPTFFSCSAGVYG